MQDTDRQLTSRRVLLLTGAMILALLLGTVLFFAHVDETRSLLGSADTGTAVYE